MITPGTGVNYSAMDGLYGGWTPAAAAPAYSGIPEGPQVTQTFAGYSPGTGPGSAAPCNPNIGLHAAGVSTAALVALLIIWCRLPV